MSSYPIERENFNSFTKLFESLQKILILHEYRTGFIQRIKDGFGIIHTPRRILTYGDAKTEILLSLFSDNKSFQISIIEKIIGINLTSGLISVGFFTLIEEKNYILSTFRIVPVNLFFVLIPFRQFNEPPVYIGADSLTFARHIQLEYKPKNVLDIATGSGFQLFNLPWQGGATIMKGLDINQNAIHTGTLNSIINKTPWISFEEKDIESDLNSLNQKFNLIIGNPPIIPTPESERIKTRLGGMIHADGGRDGFSVVRKILNQIPTILDNDGSLQLILCSLGDASKLNIATELEKILQDNELQGNLIIIKKIPIELDAYYRGQKNLKEYSRWIKFYNEEHASYWYRLILRVVKSNHNTPLNIIQLIRNDFSKNPNTERITADTIKSKISFYLSDTVIQNESFDIVSKIRHKIESLIDTENWKDVPIREFGKIIFEKLPEIFPTEGAAIRFWGQCTNEFWWKPKYLERVLW